jgi:hypothetical protein
MCANDLALRDAHVLRELGDTGEEVDLELAGEHVRSPYPSASSSLRFTRSRVAR